MKFIAKTVGKFDISVVINPRGGQKKVLETSINVIEPHIQFSN